VAAQPGPAWPDRATGRHLVTGAAGESLGAPPLSVAQEGLWYLSLLVPNQISYNEAICIRKDGPFDLGSFRRSFNEIVRRHQAWRTTFDVVGGVAVQVVRPPPNFALPRLDLSHLTFEEAERHAVHVAAEASKAPYDLCRGPLLRPRLIKFPEGHHRLYLAMHHLVFDGVSVYRVVLPELVALYDAFCAGEPSPLPEPRTQYADYARWEQRWITEPRVARRLEHWRSHLATLPVLSLPLDHPRPPTPRFRGGVVPLLVPAETVLRLREVGQGVGATLFQVLASAWSLLLGRYSGQDDVVFATATDLRQRPELESVVGYSVTPLVLRIDLSGDPAFTDLVVRVRNELLDGLDNLVPFERLVRELNPEKVSNANPIYQTMFVLEPPTVAPDPSWSMHLIESELGNAIGGSRVDLELQLDERTDGHIAGRLIYDQDLFEAASGTQMVEHWLRLLWSITQDPSRRVSTLRLLNRQERHRQLVDWNHTKADYPRAACVHDLVAAQTVSRADAVAASFGDAALTYRELDRRANAMAHHLRACGAGPGDVVGICVDRSLEMIIGLLGILKCGAAYLPLDPSHPPDRLAFITSDARASLVLGEPACADWVLGKPGGIAFVELDDVTEQASEPPPSGVTPDDLMYVVYTSGSTGRPKGVPVRHQSVVNLLTSMAREPGMTKDDCGTAFNTITFDMATSDIWLPLVTGAKIALASRQIARDAHLLSRFIADAGVTFMQATPTSWQMLLEAGWQGDSELVAVSAGEPLNPGLAEQLVSRCRVLWNAYGPTETTVWSTVGRVEAGERITIGRPIANTRAYILDSQLEPVPVGVAGELVIGGDGVAAGYLNRPEETDARFLPDPHVRVGHAFRTGDRARFLPDGRIEHLGRLDDQIKLRGYRIEPGEIEAILSSHPEVDSAVVVARDRPTAGRSLVAYLVPKASMPPVSELRDLLRTRLPSYMLPSYFVGLDELPLTSSGKVDRLGLPPPEFDEQPREAIVAGPCSELEERLLPIWERVLGIRSLGTEEDFFQLGGHSLLAVRLMAVVERDLGMTLPVVTLFERGATVRGMASAITAIAVAGGSVEPHDDDDTSINRTLPQLFAIFPNEASVVSLRHVDTPLGGEIDVVTLLAGRLGQRLDRSISFNDIVASIFEEIQRIQKSGPYFLAGWSLGGLVAYEVAGRLQASGESVAWLGLVDAPVPRKDTVARRLDRFKTHGPRRALAFVRYLRYRADTTRMRLRLFSAHIFDTEGAIRIVLAHTLSANDAPLDLFLTKRTTESFGLTAGWDMVHQGPLWFHDLPGDHNSIFRSPHATTVTRALTASISQVFAWQPSQASQG
jgi:amino acid adenylation domain-containing protein